MAKAESLRAGSTADSPTRRAEILATAASLIASSGLRTSLQEIADAAGILPGSLYHHFESKEAILVELIRRYQDDLERIGRAAQARLDEPDSRPVPEQIIELGSAIANCAVEHRAALQMSFYEGPGTDPELTKLTRQRPVAIQEAMLQTLRAGRWSGYIKPDIDLPTLADRICQTMLQVGLDVMRHTASADQVAELLCRIILQGLASRPPSDAALDRSKAFAAANEVIETWSDDSDADPGDKAALVRAVARAEFGRRGYEVTTIRDIAAAAGLGTGTVYRVIGSKDELLDSIMRSFGKKVEAGWVSVLRSDATPTEKLDALSWVNVNALDQFSDEFRIQLAWMRLSPPTANPGWSYATRLRQMKSLLSEGLRTGEIAIAAPSTAMLARCLIALQWIPENILAEIGKRPALLHVRDTVLRGVAVRGAAVDN
ncbi:TetR/AcrR family transcriptional regulator [Mycobacterium avium subsp. hominissuis]|jgi:AcrR family transcriptional regulator|uniref:TetR family transcriptional regulator n=5 Tax=Mycobacterium avium complex (MAC) TaxID=120793 RepID=A0AAW5S3Q1_MYCBC|nr:MULTISPECIES: TetR/AcrR family transcriptional regulator [Mycobacterium avium complex (MAC)]ETA99437.1 TetR family transcriptional regulator [Mycobacterium avium 10-5581]ETB31301.1 TetR family transcriptional regulator [Mycobacterium avium subsp. hominissuis 10-4249]ETB43312.1 TetR family transcriptional regulator [Mycobacterium avium subsp. hominissuis 10-5606]APA74898.1 TetR/AcrR family transcriptional regulator [Mycobacterium avium subsp. hominissuis]APT10095.1 TetR family transcriptiona